MYIRCTYKIHHNYIDTLYYVNNFSNNEKKQLVIYVDIVYLDTRYYINARWFFWLANVTEYIRKTNLILDSFNTSINE